MIDKKEDIVVNLCVGDMVVKTTSKTLLQWNGSRFQTIPQLRDAQQNVYIYIDRSPKVFVYILHYLRGHDIDYSQISMQQKRDILFDAGYYNLIHLIEELQQWVPIQFSQARLCKLNKTGNVIAKIPAIGNPTWSVAVCKYVFPKEYGFRINILQVKDDIRIGVIPSDYNRLISSAKESASYLDNHGIFSTPNSPKTECGVELITNTYVDIRVNENQISISVNGKDINEQFTIIHNKVIPCVMLKNPEDTVSINRLES